MGEGSPYPAPRPPLHTRPRIAPNLLISCVNTAYCKLRTSQVSILMNFIERTLKHDEGVTTLPSPPPTSRPPSAPAVPTESVLPHCGTGRGGVQHTGGEA
ncbi:hypothetical protein E2C01_042196 [Portunus trituberculatus]|uniref:Uncharacterized protein n=1 Tax=Portunus trituberculatus TaxID=210409 RepID=A0A5B7FVT9_PORTR|nr:hypothetical protein [Portunus trituberculatus]